MDYNETIKFLYNQLPVYQNSGNKALNLGLDKIQKLCSKESKDYRKNLAGLIKNEHEVDREKLFPIIEPYVQSYSQAYSDYSNKALL